MDAKDTPPLSEDSWQMRPTGGDADKLFLLEKQIDMLRERLDSAENDKTGLGFIYPHVVLMEKDLDSETERVTHLFERVEVLERMVEDKFSDMQGKLSEMHDKLLEMQGKFSEISDQVDELKSQMGNTKQGWKKRR